MQVGGEPAALAVGGLDLALELAAGALDQHDRERQVDQLQREHAADHVRREAVDQGAPVRPHGRQTAAGLHEQPLTVGRHDRLVDVEQLDAGRHVAARLERVADARVRLTLRNASRMSSVKPDDP